MNTDFIKGVIVPILTPVDQEERIDEGVLCRMADYVVGGGVDGILIYGSNGEFYAVEEDDFGRGIDIILDAVKGRVPVYAGIGSVTTRRCVKNARIAAEKGAQGISILQPMFIAPNEEDLYQHFKTVAEAVPELPALIYNNPRVGYDVSPKLCARLNETVENIVGVKDSSGNMTTLAEYVRLTRHTGFRVLAGKDTLIYASLAQGAVGCVATTANFLPNYVTDIYHHFMEGDWKSALDAQFRLTPIRNALDIANFPVGTKDIANLIGLDVGAPYLPNRGSCGEKLERMKEILVQEGVL